MSAVPRCQDKATFGSMATGVGLAADMSGYPGAGIVPHIRARTGATVTTTTMTTAGAITRATGIAKITANTTGITETATTVIVTAVVTATGTVTVAS